MIWKKWIGKRVYLVLKPKKYITGTVIDVEYIGKNDGDIDTCLISVKDKFDKFVAFSTNEILIIQEEKLNEEDDTNGEKR